MKLIKQNNPKVTYLFRQNFYSLCLSLTWVILQCDIPCQRGYVFGLVWFVLSARLRKTTRLIFMIVRLIWWRGVAWAKEEPITFWSGYRIFVLHFF